MKTSVMLALLLLSLALSSVTCVMADAQAAPSVQITSVPAFGVWGGYLGGTTQNANPALHRVAVYIYIPGVGWYTKPYFTTPCATIQSDGSWSALVTTGGVDDKATIFAAFLIPVEACSDERMLAGGLECLPERIGEVALDYDYRLRDNPDQRRVSFSGYKWLVKSHAEPFGPGPNYFSDGSDNVWVDPQGRLHLKITFRSGKWYCAEVICRQPLGFGTYRFDVETSINDLDPNIVLGMFTYSEACAFGRTACVDGHREIDVEFSKWGNAADPLNSQFVVQPWDCAGHMERFALPAGSSTSFFCWWQDLVQFESSVGTTVRRWVFSKAGEVPRPGQEQTRINLYLVGGNPPVGGQEKEIVISRFQFLPPVTQGEVPLIKSQAEYTPVRLTGKDVSASFDGFFYLESDDRACGIRVDKANHGLAVGMRADVTGNVQTNADGERFISAATCAQTSSGGGQSLSPADRNTAIPDTVIQ